MELVSLVNKVLIATPRKGFHFVAVIGKYYFAFPCMCAPIQVQLILNFPFGLNLISVCLPFYGTRNFPFSIAKCLHTSHYQPLLPTECTTTHYIPLLRPVREYPLPRHLCFFKQISVMELLY